jgi:hypothetical protein
MLFVGKKFFSGETHSLKNIDFAEDPLHYFDPFEAQSCEFPPPPPTQKNWI